MKTTEWIRYECGARYEWWMHLITWATTIPFIVVGILSVLGVISLEEGADRWVAGIVLITTGLLDGVLFWAILPRRLQLLQDKMRVKLGGPFALNIPFADVKAVERCNTWWHVGLSFATSFRGRILVRRRYGYDVLVSAGDRETFLDQAEMAIREWGRDHPEP